MPIHTGDCQLFWYAYMGFEEATAVDWAASPVVNLHSGDPITGVQLFPEALLLKSVRGNYPVLCC